MTEKFDLSQPDIWVRWRDTKQLLLDAIDCNDELKLEMMELKNKLSIENDELRTMVEKLELEIMKCKDE